MVKGVEILLVAGTEVPSLIRVGSKTILQSYETFLGRRVSTIRIVGIEASFIPGGQVDLRMTGSDKHIIAFEPKTVFEIRNLEDGKVVKSIRNHNLCSECAEFSGQFKEHGSGEGGRRHSVMTCPAGHTWNI